LRGLLLGHKGRSYGGRVSAAQSCAVRSAATTRRSATRG
jgi:hypothetical protein